MSDAPDWQSQQLEVWDPTTGTNVYAPGGAQSYIAANPTHYQGYTGAVQQTPAGPIHANAYDPTVGPQPSPTPSGFDPVAFQAAQEKAFLNPYDTGAYNQQLMNDWSNTVRRIPGGNPTYGVIPGSDLFYNLLSQQQVDPNTLDPFTKMFGGFTQKNPGNIPTLSQTGGPGGIAGKGYHFKGALNPQQADAAQAAMAGNPNAASFLAQSVAPAWKATPLSGMQSFAKKFYGPAIMAAPAVTSAIFAPGISAPLLGATFGALSQGAQTNFRNPGAIAAGAGAGALGGWLGGQGAQALGLGPVASGIAGGAAGGASGTAAQGAATGNLNAMNVLRNTAIGGAAGGIKGGIGSLGTGGYVNTPGEPGGGFSTPGNPYAAAIAPMASNVFSTTASALWPANDPREIARQRELARRNPNNPYQR